MKRALLLALLTIAGVLPARLEAGCGHNPYHRDCPYGGACFGKCGPGYSWGYPQGYNGRGSWGYAATQWQRGFGYLGNYPYGFGPEYGRGYGSYPSWGPAYRNRFVVNGGGYGGYDAGYNGAVVGMGGGL